MEAEEAKAYLEGLRRLNSSLRFWAEEDKKDAAARSCPPDCLYRQRELAIRTARTLRLRKEAARRRREAEELFRGLSDRRCGEILSLRYGEGLTWDQVEQRLREERFFYCRRQLYNLHRKGLLELQQALEKKEAKEVDAWKRKNSPAVGI